MNPVQVESYMASNIRKPVFCLQSHKYTPCHCFCGHFRVVIGMYWHRIKDLGFEKLQDSCPNDKLVCGKFTCDGICRREAAIPMDKLEGEITLYQVIPFHGESMFNGDNGDKDAVEEFDLLILREVC
jgi:hypothetical protein